jgi:hypothetical protein
MSTQTTADVAPRGGLRLTRRGRVVVLLSLVVLLLVAFSLGRVGTQAAPRPTSNHLSTPLPQTVVRPGETLWSVASRIAPGQDPRAVISAIEDLNGITDDQSLQAGQLLLLPRS